MGDPKIKWVSFIFDLLSFIVSLQVVIYIL